MTPVKTLNVYLEPVEAVADRVWKSEGRNHNGLAPAKQVILRLYA